MPPSPAHRQPRSRTAASLAHPAQPRPGRRLPGGSPARNGRARSCRCRPRRRRRSPGRSPRTPSAPAARDGGPVRPPAPGCLRGVRWPPGVETLSAGSRVEPEGPTTASHEIRVTTPHPFRRELVRARHTSFSKEPAMSAKHIPLAAQNSAIVLIDHQPGVPAMVDSLRDRRELRRRPAEPTRTTNQGPVLRAPERTFSRPRPPPNPPARSPPTRPPSRWTGRRSSSPVS